MAVLVCHPEDLGGREIDDELEGGAHGREDHLSLETAWVLGSGQPHSRYARAFLQRLWGSVASSMRTSANRGSPVFVPGCHMRPNCTGPVSVESALWVEQPDAQVNPS